MPNYKPFDEWECPHCCGRDWQIVAEAVLPMGEGPAILREWTGKSTVECGLCGESSTVDEFRTEGEV